MQRVGRVTRRWGVRKHPEAVARVNAFASVAATAFFYPLFKPLTSSSCALDLAERVSSLESLVGCSSQEHSFLCVHGRTQDSVVLAHVVRVLAVVLECARHSLDGRTMSKSLLELVLMVRFHDDASTLQCIVIACACCCLLTRRTHTRWHCFCSVVRHSALVGLAAIVHAAGRQQDQDMAQAIVDSSQEWLTTTVKRDPDHSCRMVAQSLLKTPLFA